MRALGRLAITAEARILSFNEEESAVAKFLQPEKQEACIFFWLLAGAEL